MRTPHLARLISLLLFGLILGPVFGQARQIAFTGTGQPIMLPAPPPVIWISEDGIAHIRGMLTVSETTMSYNSPLSPSGTTYFVIWMNANLEIVNFTGRFSGKWEEYTTLVRDDQGNPIGVEGLIGEGTATGYRERLGPAVWVSHFLDIGRRINGEQIRQEVTVWTDNPMASLFTATVEGRILIPGSVR